MAITDKQRADDEAYVASLTFEDLVGQVRGRGAAGSRASPDGPPTFAHACQRVRELRLAGRCASLRTGIRMPLRLVRAFPLFVVLAATAATHPALIAQPAAPAIVGAWVLNPVLTQRPE